MMFFEMQRDRVVRENYIAFHVDQYFGFKTLCYVHVMMEGCGMSGFYMRRRGIDAGIHTFVIATRITRYFKCSSYWN